MRLRKPARVGIAAASHRCLARTAALATSVAAVTLVFCVAAAVEAETVEISGLLSVRAQPGRSAGEPIAIDVAAGAVETLSRVGGTAVIHDLPLADDSTESFTLSRFEVFTDDVSIMETDGVTEKRLPPPVIAFFRGTAIDTAGRQLLLTVVNQRTVWAIVMDGESVTTLIGPAGVAGVPEAHELFDGRAAGAARDRTLCAGAVDGGASVPAGVTNDASPAPRSVSDEELEVEVLIDVGYPLYSQVFGSNATAAAEYVGLLMGAVSDIYQRDMRIVAKVQTLVLWSAQEPFDGADTLEQLARYAFYNVTERSGVPRDLAHYLNNHFYGGRAFLNGLCHPSLGNAVSNIDGYYSYPAIGYVWDVDVVAHEMGHNFGSPHTHCYVPPIDKCYGAEPGCYNGPSISERGEIMSYCHLLGNKQLGFRGRVGNVVRTAAESAACLPVRQAVCGDGVVDPGEECDDGNADETDCCSSACELQSAGPGFCEDGEFCTDDYACPNGGCYQQMRRCDDGNTCTIDFCDENAASCTHHSRDGASCDDGLFCTTLDTCSAGACGGQPRDCSDDSTCTDDSCEEDTDLCQYAARPPAAGCRTARTSQLKIKPAAERSRLTWNWSKGDATAAADFGDPRLTTDYSLCIYDQADQLVTSARLPAAGSCAGRSCWNTLRTGGYRYGDRETTPDGVVATTLKAGIQDRARIVLRGKGTNLDLPTLPIGAGSLKLQLRRSGNDTCWESQFAPPFTRDDTQFSDKETTP